MKSKFNTFRIRVDLISEKNPEKDSYPYTYNTARDSILKMSDFQYNSLNTARAETSIISLETTEIMFEQIKSDPEFTNAFTNFRIEIDVNGEWFEIEYLDSLIEDLAAI